MANIQAFFANRQRVIIVDIITFVFNLVLMLTAVNLLSSLTAQANQGVVLAETGLVVFYFGLIFLLPIGAVLKRRTAHMRSPGINEAFISAPLSRLLLLAYFLTQLMYLIFASNLVIDTFSSGGGDMGRVYTALFFGDPILAGVNTFLVYHYFKPPKANSSLRFLYSPQSENLGDALVTVGILCNQMLWWYLLNDAYFTTPANGPLDLLNKLLSFVFLALFIYFPPRFFYLAESVSPWRTWLMAALVSLPFITGVLFGHVFP